MKTEYVPTPLFELIFREVEKKANLTWHENGTISYRRIKFWYFERELSVGPLTDRVTTINVPVVGSAEFARGDFLMEWGISDMLSTIEVRALIVYKLLTFG